MTIDHDSREPVKLAEAYGGPVYLLPHKYDDAFVPPLQRHPDHGFAVGVYDMRATVSMAMSRTPGMKRESVSREIQIALKAFDGERSPVFI
jgi:hypothetical protein